MDCEAMRRRPANKGLPKRHRGVARIRQLQRRAILQLLISGSQVRALVRPPPSPLFWRFAETVEKGPLLAGFFISAQTDSDLRSRKCGDFDPQSPVPNFPFLARFRESPVVSQGTA